MGELQGFVRKCIIFCGSQFVPRCVHRTEQCPCPHECARRAQIFLMIMPSARNAVVLPFSAQCRVAAGKTETQHVICSHVHVTSFAFSVARTCRLPALSRSPHGHRLVDQCSTCA